MKQIRKRGMALLLALALAAASAAPASFAQEGREAQAASRERSQDPAELGYVPGEILVTYKESTPVEEVQAAVEEQEGVLEGSVTQVEDAVVAQVTIAQDTTVASALAAYQEDPRIESATPNYLLELYEDGGGVDLSQPYLSAIRAEKAWEALEGQQGTPVRVAVIDSGARLTHEDLSGVINKELSKEWVRDEAGARFIPLRGDGYVNGTQQQMGESHGTHVAGIIAAQAGNQVGIKGAASAAGTDRQDQVVELVVIDIFHLVGENGKENASAEALYDALDYAREVGCKVINLSLGTSTRDPRMEAKCRELEEAGITLVAAGGNDGTTASSYPADFDSVLSVINVTEEGGSWRRSSTSSYGPAKDLSAPGDAIVSTGSQADDAYAVKSGTSMAAPMVSAAAAMLLYAHPGLTPAQVRSLLEETALDIGAKGRDDETGYGLLDAGAALERAAAQEGDASSDPKPSPLQTPHIAYQPHVQTYGWMSAQRDGALAGTEGESKRLEALKIYLEDAPYSGSVEYQVHVQSYGWMSAQRDGALAGTEGESKRVEAIRISLTGEMAGHFDIYYRVHAQTYGWLDWAKNGQEAGSAGYGKRLEAIEIRLVEKGGQAPGSTATPYRHALIQYQSHIQDVGWQGYKIDGALSGTTGESKRLEAVRINLPGQDYEGGLTYRTHVQTYGWQEPVRGGALSGTEGQSKRLEAIEISLTGEMAKHYDLYYRVHSQTYGWLDWAKNGEPAGTEGLSKRLEALEIRLVAKGAKAPGSTARPFVK